MTGKRKRYSADFKAKAALKGELTLSQLAAKHGVHQTMIAAWRKQAIESNLLTWLVFECLRDGERSVDDRVDRLEWGLAFEPGGSSD